MANRKQQNDKEVAESVQRVAEANASPAAPKPKPSTKNFEINKRAKAAIAAPMHPRAKKDKVNRKLELISAAEEARMQGQKELQTPPATPKYSAIEKQALTILAKQAQAKRKSKFVSDTPKDPRLAQRVKDKLRKNDVKPLTTREAGVDLAGTGGQKLTDKEGKKLKSYGDYSNWKKKSSDKRK
jgi:hypothetical protein